jgi:hypothetical protein
MRTFQHRSVPGYADAARVGILLIVFKVSRNVSILNLYQRV